MSNDGYCPVCGEGDYAYLNCNYAGCTDGRGLIPKKKHKPIYADVTVVGEKIVRKAIIGYE